MMHPDPGEIEVKMQRYLYYKSLSEKDHSIWPAIKALKVR
jgi:hypothetical protein